MMVQRDPVIVALDCSENERLLYLADILRGEVETVKVGLEAFSHMGPGIIDMLRDSGYRVFVDLKLHDIPHTVSGAVAALVRRGAGMLTVHTSGGRAMLEAAAEAVKREADAAGIAPPLLLGVTVLTSLDDADLTEIGWSARSEETVLSLAELGMQAGLDGVVASPHEVAALRAVLGQEAVIVTPGIRPEGGDAHDQARMATPREALSAGADFLVIGRPIIAQGDPLAALRDMRRTAGLL